MYTKQQLGQELKEQLLGSYNPIQIAKWAEHVHYNYRLQLPQELYDIVEVLAVMSMGPEFEYSKDELLMLAEKLIKNEKDPLQQIRHKNSSS